MNLEVTPETVRFLLEELRNGHFDSLDDLILSSVRALHERSLSMAGMPRKAVRGSSAYDRERADRFAEWAKDHPDTPALSNQAISRDSLTPDRW